MVRKAVILAARENTSVGQVYNGSVMEKLSPYVDIYQEWVHSGNLKQHAEQIRQAEIAFSTWGIPEFTEEDIKTYLPNLKVLFYGAGSVQRFARTFISQGVTVVSSWAANAVPVAEFTASQIVLANKGFYRSLFRYKQDNREALSVARMYPGNFGARVGILGAGMIGKKVIRLLKAYELSIDVFDPFLPDAAAAELGVRKTDLLDIFTNCDTISNHLANLPATEGMLHKEHFDRMQPHATFINTGRGAQVVEADLIRALKEVPTRTAVLDVTFPEPVRPDSDFLNMDNVFLTPHIAGSMNREIARMGHYMAEECERYCNCKPLQYEVTLPMLETMA